MAGTSSAMHNDYRCNADGCYVDRPRVLVHRRQQRFQPPYRLVEEGKLGIEEAELVADEVRRNNSACPLLRSYQIVLCRVLGKVAGDNSVDAFIIEVTADPVSRVKSVA